MLLTGIRAIVATGMKKITQPNYILPVVPQKGWGLINSYPFTRKQSWPQSCEDPLQLTTATGSS